MHEPRSSEGKFFTKEKIAVLIIMVVFAVCSIGIYMYYDQSIKELEKEKQKILQGK